MNEFPEIHHFLYFIVILIFLKGYGSGIFLDWCYPALKYIDRGLIKYGQWLEKAFGASK